MKHPHTLVRRALRCPKVMLEYLDCPEYSGGVTFAERDRSIRREELPRDQPALIHCHAGMLSAQAAFALRVAGLDNVKVLLGCYLEWQRKGGLATAKPVAKP